MHEQDTAIPLPPFDQGMRNAIREARFKTTNLGRSIAIIYDSDEALIQATGCDFSRYERAPKSAPGVYDYEARSADQRVIDFVASLHDSSQESSNT